MNSRVLVRTGQLALISSLFLLIPLPGCSSKEEKTAKHLENARVHAGRQEYQKTVIELRNVIQLDPENSRAHFELGEAYLKLRQGNEALQAFLRATSIDPKNMKAQLRVGQILLLGKRPDEARKRAELVLEGQPDDSEALALLSGIQIQERDIEGALQTLKKALATSPTDPFIHLSLGRLYLAKNDPENAKKAYSEAISLNPKMNTAYVELSRVHALSGETAKAEEVLRNMIQASGENSPNLRILSQFYESIGQWEKAEKIHLLCADAAQKEDVSPLLSLGAFYARRNSYEKALASMEKALEIRKGDLDVMAAIAQLDFDFERFQEASGVVDRILEKDRGHIMANLLKGRLYLNQRDYPQALEKFNLVIRDRPRSDAPYYYRAITLLEKGEPKMAEPDLLKALDLNPGLLDARLILAQAYLSERNKDLARQQIDTAQKMAPADARVVSLLGDLKVLEENPGAAEEAFKRLVQLRPADAASYVRLGSFYSSTGKLPEAERCLQKALELNPGQTEAHGLLTGIYIEQRKYDEALRLCRVQRQRLENHPRAIGHVEYLQGTVLLSKGENKRALESFETAVEKDPDILGAYEAMAQIHLLEKRLAQAKQQYEKILTKNPKYLPAYMALGTVREKMGDRKEAEILYRKALEVDKEFAPAANNLAWTLIGTGGNIDEALGLAQTAKQKMPNSSAIMDTLGWIYCLKGSYMNAVSELQDAARADSGNPVIHYHLGVAYRGNRQPDKAVESLEEALSISSSFKGADQARNLLEEMKGGSPTNQTGIVSAP